MASSLSKPSDGPIVVAADSTQEALAFLAQLFSERGGDELSAYRDRVLIFDKPGVLARLAEGAWITTVRNSCTDLSRSAVADQCIGKLFARAPGGVDGVWPCEQVRDVMEAIQSEDIMRGAHTGVYNSRGAHFRSEGGGQERELADRYRNWGHALQLSHPFVASKLLMELVRTYDNEASYHDTEAGIRRRLR
jgi:hypothetical protein